MNNAFQAALDAMGGEIHILVNCAGIQRRSPAVQFSDLDWNDVSLGMAVFEALLGRGLLSPSPSSFNSPLSYLISLSLTALSLF